MKLFINNEINLSLYNNNTCYIWTKITLFNNIIRVFKVNGYCPNLCHCYLSFYCNLHNSVFSVCNFKVFFIFNTIMSKD